MTAEYNFDINVGADFTKVFRWKQADGTYVDFTDYEVVMNVRYDSINGELIFQLSDTDGITTASDRFTVEITDTQSSLLDVNKVGYYDIFITKDGYTEKLVKGQITINPRVKPKGVDE